MELAGADPRSRAIPCDPVRGRPQIPCNPVRSRAGQAPDPVQSRAIHAGQIPDPVQSRAVPCGADPRSRAIPCGSCGADPGSRAIPCDPVRGRPQIPCNPVRGRSSWHAWVLDCVESPMAVRLFRASPCGSVRAPQGGVRSVQFRASPCVPSRGVSGVVLGTRGFWIAWKAQWLCGYFVQVRAVPCAPHRAGCVPCNSVQVRACPQGACRA